MTLFANLRCLLATVGGFAGTTVLALPAADAPERERVVVVANTDDPDSLSLARYYMAARGVPAENLVTLKLRAAETIGWPEFVDTLFNPLFAELAQRGWIDAMRTDLADEFGRRKAVIGGHRMSYLVLVRGVPLRIDTNPAWKPPSGPGAPQGDLATNRAAVDGELALLAMGDTAVAGWVRSPLCGEREPTGPLAQAVVRVARLDGPTPDAVRTMIDGAIAGERDGLAGRAYVDFGGPHAEGDRWMESVTRQLADAGFETDADKAKTTFPPLARFDAPVLYFGWYAWNVDGPFTVPGFRFPPGAVAVHIHSYSAQTLRTDSRFWCGPLLARGATATVGNVFEPYLGLTHHLDLLVEALLRGETFGAAAYYALPGLSWQGVALGDPLYRPFARSQAAQFAEGAKLAPEQRTYVVLRQAQLELKAGHGEEALKLARGVFRETPSVPLGVSVAQLTREVEGPAAAVRALAFLEMLQRYEVRDLGAVWSAARLLVEWGDTAKALVLYEKTLAQPPPVGEIPLLEEAIAVALKAGLPARAAKWQDRLAAIKPPPPPPKKKP
ncbi:MAG TPA: TIGR03790 family protein [Opitutaceae bacterium]|nr:TIGR03790 family protein [Opitutaceae bacterium]